MDKLTAYELMFFMELISDKFGFGYSSIKEIGRLQAKLSIMAEVAAKTRRGGEPIDWRGLLESKPKKKVKL